MNIACIYGAVGDLFPTALYYASKGAAVNLTRALAVKWVTFEINVNAIASGFFPSEMTASVFKEEKATERILFRTPLERMGAPLDL